MFSAVLRHPICVSMIAPLPPSERVIKRPIETYEISREKKKIYLIVRISCTLIQPIHSVIWYETPHQNFHQSPRFLVPIFWRSSVNYFIFATSQSDRVIMPAGFLFFSYPPKTTSAKPHQYERHKNHSRHSNITKRLPIRDIRPSQFATKRALERRKMSSKRSDIIPKLPPDTRNDCHADIIELKSHI